MDYFFRRDPLRNEDEGIKWLKQFCIYKYLLTLMFLNIRDEILIDLHQSGGSMHFIVLGPEIIGISVPMGYLLNNIFRVLL